MNLEGLQAILEKKEVVPTVSAADILERPELVEQGYLYHVRTYLPISRAAEGGEGQISVDEFERRLIKEVKEAAVPRGYITAGYGYGKTSTALYLWQRAEAARIVTVPPFQLEKLPDFVTATYGWLRYRLGSSRPGLIESLDQLYHTTIDRSLERIAEERQVPVEALWEMMREGILVPDLQPVHFMKFFEQATQLARDAGYEGLVVLPDEIQQYFRPRLAEKGDPIAPFFQIIQLLNTRAAHHALNFGFIMIITAEELAIIRDTYRRNDLLHRMKDLQIDLTTLYDEAFAPKLWEAMAKQFEFAQVKGEIVADETLASLGQITARPDLSDGPRTVVNVFRRMVEVYQQRGKRRGNPYTPVDLIDDFLDEQKITFGGNDKLRTVTRRALQTPMVRDNPERFARAIKLAAAYPSEGVPRALQDRYRVSDAMDELMRAAIGEVVRSGSIKESAVALVGLDRVQIQTDWLPNTIREYRLGYNEQATITRDRALAVFKRILKERVFRGWRVESERDHGLTCNRSIIFEGAFDSIKAKFPRRRVHVRIYWEDEALNDAEIDGDVCIEYCLTTYPGKPLEERRTLVEPVELNLEACTGIVPVNLMFTRPESVNQAVRQQLRDVWSPFDLSPLVLANMYQMIEEKREDNQIPKKDDQLIKNGFQPELLDTLVQEMFNEVVGAPLDAAGFRITESLVGYLLEARFRDTYVTLSAPQNWRSSIQKYVAALSKLETPYERRGEIAVSGTKDDIAGLFTLSNVGLDSFQRSFSQFLLTTKEFRGGAAGAVKFTQHPLELQISGWLRQSRHVDSRQIGGKTVEVRRLPVSGIIREAYKLGYQTEEVDALLDVMQARDLIDKQQDWVIEIPDTKPDAANLRQQIGELERDLLTLMEGFNSGQLRDWHDQLEKLAKRVVAQEKSGKADAAELTKVGNTIRTRRKDVERFAADQRQALRDQLKAVGHLRNLPSDWTQTLQTPIQLNVEYEDQVNVLREVLDRAASNVVQGVAEYQKRADETARELEDDVMAFGKLAQLAGVVTGLTEQLGDVVAEVEGLESAYHQFSRWRDLVTSGAAVLNDIGNLPEQERQAFRETYAVLSREIRAEISSHSAGRKLDALPRYAAYAERLTTLTEQVRKKREAGRVDFDHMQTACRAALAGTHLLDENEWRKIAYNPSNPVDSRDQLVRQTINNLSRVLSGIQRLLGDSERALQVVEGNLNHVAGRDRARLTTAIESAVQTGTQLEAHSESMKASIQAMAAMPDFVAQTTSHCDMLAALRDGVLNLRQTSEALKNELDVFSPTQTEQKLLDYLEEMGADRSVDLFELRAACGLDDIDFWGAVKGLFEKDRARILIGMKQA